MLAGGSNVVISDEGVPGTVVLVRTRGIARDGTQLVVQAGEPWDDVVAYCVDEGLQGFECLSGIPGSTGATPIQNVGAYGQEVSETVEWVRVYDRETDRVETIRAADCGFGYRTQPVQVPRPLDRPRRRVPAAGVRRVRSAALRRGGRALGRRAAPRWRDVRAAVLGLRRGKGMVIDPSDPDSVSAGSFFTNPILPEDQFAALPGSPPAFPEADGRMKTSAAWLIERAGFSRGSATDVPGSPPSTRSRS